MLRMETVTQEFRHRRGNVRALDEASAEIPGGDFVAISGPSGSGKSTLLLLLGGMLRPTSGAVYWDADRIYDLTPSARARLRRKKVGFLFQTFNLVPYLTAEENVQVPLFLARAPATLQRSRARELLERVGLSDRVDHKPSELSIGQQQRVALARVLANDPEVILADEPTGNLDPQTGGEIISFLEELNREGRTIVMVTHDPVAAARAARRLILEEGRIRA